MFQFHELTRFLEELSIRGDWRAHADFTIEGASPVSESRPRTITWMRKQDLDWSRIRAAVIVCARDFTPPAGSAIVFIPVENPRLVFTRILRRFFLSAPAAGIDPSARIGEDCTIGAGVAIGPYCVIGREVVIGARCEIRNHVVIGDRTVMGADCVIRSHAVVGEECLGAEIDEAGHPLAVPHVGRVVLGHDVRIGSFSTVSRATLGETRIGDYVQIDDHVHVAHNVTIESDTIVTGCAEISGGVHVGPGVWLGPNCALIQKIRIGGNALIGIGAVVLKDVEADRIAAAMPASLLPASLNRPARETAREGE